MAVALFSGTLTQFFLGAWIDELPPDEAGDDDADDEEPDTNHDPEGVRALFDGVRASLVADLAPHARTPPLWAEAVSGPHAAAVLEDEEYGALMLFAARLATQGTTMPAYNKKRAWTEDAAVRTLRLSERGVGTMHHLVKADTWLPGDFLPIAVATFPYADVQVGSTTQLEAALARVGEALAAGGVSLPAETVAAARRGHELFVKILAHSAAQRLPMVVDP